MIGEKRISKLLEEIENKRELTLSEFLSSLGIAGLGKRRVELVQEAMPGEFDLLTDWTENLKLVKYSDKIGLPNIAQNLYAELNKLKPLIEKFLKAGVKIISTKHSIKNIKNAHGLVCITGSLSKGKSYYAEKITDAGFNYTNTFTKNITILVTNDLDSNTTKMQKAKKYGMQVITEKELITLLNLDNNQQS
jgi:DNA ligase (NAD+)